MIVSKTPFRITLGGGGTDLPSYYESHESIVLTMAIDKHVYITLKPDDFEEMCKLRYSEIECVKNASLLRNTRAKEVLCGHGVSNVEINTCADLSTRSGLGSSGSFLVGLIKAVREYKQLDHGPKTVADEACEIEISRLKEPVGKQDQYIAAFGGVKLLRINKAGVVDVEPFIFNHDQLVNNMHVYSLNMVRNASDVLSAQNNSSSQVVDALHQIKEYCHRTIELLKAGDFDEYGLLLDSYWTTKRKLSSKVSMPIVDELYQTVKERFGVLGGKIVGAGGGGFLLLYANTNQDRLEDFMKKIGMKRLKYSVDELGSRVVGNFL